MYHRLSLTRGKPRFIAMRVADEEAKLPIKEHSIYRSGVGTLLYMTKHSRPDVFNAAKELSKTMDRPAPVHQKELYRFIRYVLNTEEYGLNIILKDVQGLFKPSVTVIFAGDKETRRSVYGYLIYFCGIPIAWKSKGMRSVVL